MESVKEMQVTKDDGECAMSRIGEFRNEDGDLSRVWLPDIVEKELSKIDDFEKEQVYIRSNGLKLNKKGTRKYFHFDIVNQ